LTVVEKRLMKLTKILGDVQFEEEDRNEVSNILIMESIGVK
jgi:hypothetical protein